MLLIAYTCPHCGDESHVGDKSPSRYTPKHAKELPRTLLYVCPECGVEFVLEYTPMIKADAFKIDR